MNAWPTSHADHLHPICTDRPKRLRVAVLASATGANLGTLLHLAAQEPSVLEVVLVVSDREAPPARVVAESAGVPFWPGDFTARCGTWSQCTDADARATYRARATAYHDDLTARLAAFEDSEGPVDLVVLAYHRWIHGELLRRYADRIINQHPADLAVRTGAGRSYVGNDPVLAALADGRRATRTSTFLVDDTHDGGPVLARGPEVAFPEGVPVTAEAAAAHELVQKRRSDPGALAWTVRAIAHGRLAVDEQCRHPDGVRAVALDQQPLPYAGFDAPPFVVPETSAVQPVGAP